MALDPRKAQILRLIVEVYIESGEPVGSKALAEMLGNCVSSATIRNDMAALTADGYLEQPHTSAGRLPTSRALRLYVNELMARRQLPLQEKVLIGDTLSALSGDATRLLEDATRALADITGLAAFATRPEQIGNRISRLDVIQMSPRNMAVLLVQDNGFLRTRMCRCRRDIPSRVTVALAEYMSRRFLSKPLEAVTVTAMQEILLELGNGGMAVTPILSAFYELAQECADAKVALSGQMNLLRNPDYPPEQARMLLAFLNERQPLWDLVGTLPDGVQVLLGDDSLPALHGSAVITSRYSLGERGDGIIGIIGPARMDYATAIPRVEYFAAAVGRILDELLDTGSALDI